MNNVSHERISVWFACRYICNSGRKITTYLRTKWCSKVMIHQITNNVRLLDKLICLVGAFILTVKVFPPNNPPPVFPFPLQADEE